MINKEKIREIQKLDNLELVNLSLKNNLLTQKGNLIFKPYDIDNKILFELYGLFKKLNSFPLLKLIIIDIFKVISINNFADLNILYKILEFKKLSKNKKNLIIDIANYFYNNIEEEKLKKYYSILFINLIDNVKKINNNQLFLYNLIISNNIQNINKTANKHLINDIIYNNKFYEYNINKELEDKYIKLKEKHLLEIKIKNDKKNNLIKI